MLKYYLYRYFCKLGWQGLLGLFALISMIPLYVLLLHPANHHLQDLKTSLGENKFEQNLNQQAKPTPPIDFVEPLLNQFPEMSSSNESFRAMAEAIEDEGLLFENANYETHWNEHTGLAYRQVSFSLKGSYIKLKTILANILLTIPNAAISSLSFKRNNVDDGQVEMAVTWQVFFRVPEHAN